MDVWCDLTVWVEAYNCEAEFSFLTIMRERQNLILMTVIGLFGYVSTVYQQIFHVTKKYFQYETKSYVSLRLRLCETYCEQIQMVQLLLHGWLSKCGSRCLLILSQSTEPKYSFLVYYENACTVLCDKTVTSQGPLSALLQRGDLELSVDRLMAWVQLSMSSQFNSI